MEASQPRPSKFGEMRPAIAFGVIGLGLALRLTLTFTSIGTNDVVFKILWAKLVREYGIGPAYGHMWELNHPPLALLLFHGLDRLAEKVGANMTDLLRVVQALADCATFFCLRALSRRLDLQPRAATLFFLAPAAIAISGFHCNTDPLMLALFIGAVALLVHGRDGASGALAAAAVGIKIVPLFFLPMMFVAAGRRARFSLAFVAVAAAIFVPAWITGGSAMLHNVFGYSGFAGKWGVPALLLEIERLRGLPRQTVLYEIALAYSRYGKYFVLAAVAGIAAVFLWRGGKLQDVPAAIGVTFLAILFFAPGYGVQYLDWLLPLLPFAMGRNWFAALYTAINGYVLLTYTVWSQGFPWWYADSIAPSPLKPMLTMIGIGLWLLIGAALLRRKSSAIPQATTPPR